MRELENRRSDLAISASVEQPGEGDSASGRLPELSEASFSEDLATRFRDARLWEGIARGEEDAEGNSDGLLPDLSEVSASPDLGHLRENALDSGEAARLSQDLDPSADCLLPDTGTATPAERPECHSVAEPKPSDRPDVHGKN